MSVRPAATRVDSSAGRPWRPRLPTTAAAVALLLWLWPSVVWGHAQLVAADPPDGARLGVAPAAVSLTFNEQVALAARGLEVVDRDGRRWDEGPEAVEGTRVSQPVAALPDGWYLARWAILSQDGHIVRGSFTFAVGDADAAPPAAMPPDLEALLGTATRSLADLGLLVATGAWSAWWLLAARGATVRRLALLSALTALAATLAWAALQVVEGGTDWASTPYALAVWARILLVAAALLLARTRGRGSALLLLAALWTLALGGHASGSLVTSLLIAVHLTAAAVWLGAVPAVALVLWGKEHEDAPALVVARRFSRLAGYALVVVGVAGALVGLRLTDGLAGGVDSPYLQLLGAKVALVGVAALAGAYGRWQLGHDPQRRRMRQLFALDVGLLVAVVGLSALLTTVAPGAGHAGHGGQAGLGADGSSRCAASVGDASTAIVVTPGRAGDNEVLVSGIGHDVLEVTLALGHGSEDETVLRLPLSHAARGWATSVTLPFGGTWHGTLIARVDRFTEARGACSLTIGP